LANVNCLFCC